VELRLLYLLDWFIGFGTTNKSCNSKRDSNFLIFFVNLYNNHKGGFMSGWELLIVAGIVYYFWTNQ